MFKEPANGCATGGMAGAEGASTPAGRSVPDPAGSVPISTKTEAPADCGPSRSTQAATTSSPKTGPSELDGESERMHPRSVASVPPDVGCSLHGFGGCFLELGVVQVEVEPAVGDQLVVAALFDDLAVVHDEDRVGVADGREAVGDDEGRAALH